MTKQDFKALLMKVETVYNTASLYKDYSRHSQYELMKAIINMIEENQGKKLEAKKTFTLIKGEKDV